MAQRPSDMQQLNCGLQTVPLLHLSGCFILADLFLSHGIFRLYSNKAYAINTICIACYERFVLVL